MLRTIPEFLLAQLGKLEPDASFTGQPPKVQSSTTGKSYFVKVGSPTEQEQYQGEAESLIAINIAAPGLAPKVFSFGTSESGESYFISEYKDINNLTTKAADDLAKRLATELHQYKSLEGFGFQVPTYCGKTRQKNGWHESWEKCYDAMIENLLQDLAEKGQGYESLINKTEEVRKSIIPKLLGGLIIQPVLLHGDLWSGNAGVDANTGHPVIFDPSSYYGHNEADLAIARIFGGFPQSFYETYHKYQPVTEPTSQYNLRMELYELYHYLNHTLLFGATGYMASANRIVDKLLSATASL